MLFISKENAAMICLWEFSAVIQVVNYSHVLRCRVSEQGTSRPCLAAGTTASIALTLARDQQGKL